MMVQFMVSFKFLVPRAIRLGCLIAFPIIFSPAQFSVCTIQVDDNENENENSPNDKVIWVRLVNVNIPRDSKTFQIISDDGGPRPPNLYVTIKQDGAVLQSSEYQTGWSVDFRNIDKNKFPLKLDPSVSYTIQLWEYDLFGYDEQYLEITQLRLRRKNGKWELYQDIADAAPCVKVDDSGRWVILEPADSLTPDERRASFKFEKVDPNSSPKNKE